MIKVMNIKEIEILIEKFYEGETTSSEEQKLRDFFSKEEIPPHLAIHADLFRFYEQDAKEEIPDPGFEEHFLAKIDAIPTIEMNTSRRRLFYLTGIAAAILLLFGTVFTFRHDIFTSSTQTLKEQEIAYQQAKNAIAMLSTNFNVGLDQAQKLENFQKGLEQVQKLQAFQKGIDQMNKFSKYYQYQPIIINQGN